MGFVPYISCGLISYAIRMELIISGDFLNQTKDYSKCIIILEIIK
jgi:hypothetical protein